MNKKLLFVLLCLFFPLMAVYAIDKKEACPMVHVVAERLPDLTIPRSGHSTFFVNGELTVTGGHTTNFIPASTAEYYTNGTWHPMKMAYTHDNGFAVKISDNVVIIGGGHEKPLGIGQTFMLERYRADKHSFDGFGCLDRQRALSSATLLDGGLVVISGNHYASDGIGCFDGSSQVQDTKSVYQGRSNPYIFPISSDDAIIFGGNDIYDKHPDTIWVDRIKGEPFYVPMLSRWRPVYTDQPFSSEACGIGKYTYLLTVTDSVGQLGFVEVSDTTFTLLPTTCPVPMRCKFGPIFYKGPIAIDRERSRGYVIGVDSLCRRQYVLSVDFSRTPASLTLYYTDILEHSSITIPVVTPEGDLLLVGGIHNDNYKPLASVWLYHFGSSSEEQAAEQTTNLLRIPLWLWILLTISVLLILAHIIYLYRNRKHTAASPLTSNDPQSTDEELMQRICQSIERDRQYLTSRLRLSDIAVELGVSVTTLTDCIQSQRHCTFAQLIAEYRVHYAQQLLSENPEMKLYAVIAESGFTSESTFFRSFKAVTGLSPKEWLTQSAKLD